MRRILAAVTAAVVLGLGLLTGTAHASGLTPGQRLLAAAETRAGDWYSYGSAGPSTFDCSGLVVWAARQVGITLPRTTFGMLGSSHLMRTYHPVAGDLAFYGSGHVEIVQRGNRVTFGAQQTGTRVGNHVWNSYWRPTMFFRVG